MSRILIGLAAAFGLFSRAALACDLALALGVDVSGSVDKGEYRLQMDGMAQALRDPLIAEALVRGKSQIMLVQWSGASRQQVTIPWVQITDFVVLDALADRIASDPRIWRNYSTAIGDALSFTLNAFPAEPSCKRLLIDLSGDGFSNEGSDPRQIHARLTAAGVVVNAIAIEASEPDLTAYFYENVIVGEGAFVVTAHSFEDYPDKIRKKLLREITQQTAQAEDKRFAEVPFRDHSLQICDHSQVNPLCPRQKTAPKTREAP